MSSNAGLWTVYRVRWQFLTRLCGQTPCSPDLIRAWLEARQPAVKPPNARSIEEINEEVVESLARGEQEDQFTALTFQTYEGGLVFRAGTIKAHIKDCARVLSVQFVGKIKGERAFSSRVINGVYPDERTYWVPIVRPDGTPVTRADGAYDKAIHVMTRQGQINALKRFEYVEPPSVMEFTIKVLGASVAESDLHHVFTYGGVHGYAGERGDGEGRYTYELERLTPSA